MKAPSATADIGLIGLAVMGENLVLNMESRGNTVAVFNRTTSKVDGFVNGRGKGKKVVGTRLKGWKCGCSSIWSKTQIEAVCERCGRAFRGGDSSSS